MRTTDLPIRPVAALAAGGLSASLLLAPATAHAAHAADDADARATRTVIASTTVAALPSSDVVGRTGGTRTGVRMYYDARDQRPGYARTENLWNRDWSLYVDPESALGPKGPLGHLGPLGALGPLKNRAPSWSWGAWSPPGYGDLLGGGSRVLGPAGPLGENGPLTERALYTDMYHLNETGGSTDPERADDANDFPHQLDPAGIWGVLGPAGPLGALGPLGPLGPLGHGATVGVRVDASTGEHRDRTTGGTLRQVDVPFDARGTVTRRYDVVETYPRANLVSRQANPTRFVNDTSFSVDAVSSWCTADLDTRSANTYYFRSDRDQWLSLTLTDVNAYADLGFSVTVEADPSNTFSRSTNAATWFGERAADLEVHTRSSLVMVGGVGYARGLQDFAMLRVRRGEVIRVVVDPAASRATGFDRCGYLLHVVGTGFDQRTGAGAWAASTLFDPARTSPQGRTTFNVVGRHQLARPW